MFDSLKKDPIGTILGWLSNLATMVIVAILFWIAAVLSSQEEELKELRAFRAKHERMKNED